MKCKICGKQATVRVCQILRGREVHLHYCAQHAVTQHWLNTPGAKCEVCGKPATVHESGFVGGQKVEGHYCTEHSEQAGIPSGHVTDGRFKKTLEALELFVTQKRRVPTREEIRELGFVDEQDVELAAAMAEALLSEPDEVG